MDTVTSTPDQHDDRRTQWFWTDELPKAVMLAGVKKPIVQ
jgi:hypothetical protein